VVSVLISLSRQAKQIHGGGDASRDAGVHDDELPSDNVHVGSADLLYAMTPFSEYFLPAPTRSSLRTVLREQLAADVS
jgi:hypothetical protein